MDIKQEGRCLVSRISILLVGFLFLFVTGCGTQDGLNADPGNGGNLPPGEPQVAKLEITSSTEVVGVNGVGRADLIVRALNSNNVLLEGVTIDLSASMGAISLGIVTTDASGTASFTFDSGTVGDDQVAIITASTGNVTAEKSISISADSTGGGSDSVGESIILSSTLAPGEILAQRGEITFTAKLTDLSGLPVSDGTEVHFWASSGIITQTSYTIAGQAVASYYANSAGGRVRVVATRNTISADGTTSAVYPVNEMSFTVASGAAAVMQTVSIVPERIGLRGSGDPQIATVTFSLADSNGNPVSDGQIVNFTLNSPTGGAEFVSSSSMQTVNGEVFVSIASGRVAGVATVTATAESELGAVVSKARVTMGYSQPDQLHVGIAAETLNVPGLVKFGIENTITAYVADRFSNPVPAQTPVYFASECGIMSLEDNSGIATNLTNNFGIATAVAVTAQPVSDHCRLLIWTQGEEAYTDSNGNGMYDVGEPHQGIGEPYIDANDNGTFDPSELYFDLDGNGQYTDIDDVWDADTFVWTSQNVLWSGIAATPRISPGAFDESTSFFSVTVEDVNGNPLPAGSTAKISTTCGGTLSGSTDVTLPDAVYAGAGTTIFNFKLSDNDIASDPENCSITVDVSAGINGDSTKTIFGRL